MILESMTKRSGIVATAKQKMNLFPSATELGRAGGTELLVPEDCRGLALSVERRVPRRVIRYIAKKFLIEVIKCSIAVCC